MKPLNSIRLAGRDVLPLIEGGKGIAVSNGQSTGAWAAAGGVGTFSGVNADSYDANGNVIPQTYRGKTRRERHHELINFSIEGGVTQAKIAHDMAGSNGLIHVNVLWEMGACEHILEGILDGTKGLIKGVTCGAGMPYKLAELCAQRGIYYYPIVSSGRAFNALWKRAYHKFPEWLGAVVYEDPWRAGGHNGLSNSENPEQPQDPMPRVLELRKVMREAGQGDKPIIMAGGVWWLSEWEDWLDNAELGPIAFQFGTRPLLTQESPISSAWKTKLLTLKAGDVNLNKFSPTGFYSSAVRNPFLRELQERSARQIPFTTEPVGEHTAEMAIGARGRKVYVVPADKTRAESWMNHGFTEAMRTPDNTLIFVDKARENEILKDQIDCMGCLSQCLFSNWAQNEEGTTGKKADPRSFCIQKTLQNISHSEDVDDQLMFAGHNAYRFASDPFYAGGFIPTVKQLLERIATGY